jgi:hypothetical protein
MGSLFDLQDESVFVRAIHDPKNNKKPPITEYFFISRKKMSWWMELGLEYMCQNFHKIKLNQLW